MLTTTTNGMASAYIYTQSTSFTELEHHSSNTGGDLFINLIPITEEKDLIKLLESEFVFIQVPSEYDRKAFYTLSLKCQFQAFANGVYGLKKGDMRFLYEAGIPYDEISNP